MGHEVWAVADAYETYVGRWSRPVAAEFVRRLRVPPGGAWLDAGCGTGALTQVVLGSAEPAEVVGVDPAEAFLDTARARVTGATFLLADAQALPLPDRHFDAVVGGLMLNFVPDPERAVAEFARVARPGAVVGAYVWDYAAGMAMMRHFWSAAAHLDPAAAALDEGTRFPLCRPDALQELWAGAGMHDVSVWPIDVDTVFRDFDDYWTPFLGGQGPAPGYTMSLSEERREALRDRLRSTLPFAADGSLPLTARAWAVMGTVPISGGEHH